jgi:hypothetical protein
MRARHDDVFGNPYWHQTLPSSFSRRSQSNIELILLMSAPLGCSTLSVS